MSAHHLLTRPLFHPVRRGPHPESLLPDCESADWLAPARARLHRQVAIARRERVMDLGEGYGAVTEELVGRSGGAMLAVDRYEATLSYNPINFEMAWRICADATQLPFADG